MDLLSLLEMRKRDLPPAEAAVADAILRDPASAVDYSVAQLAAAAGSGEATVSRFCRRIGLSGFGRLRTELAVALERIRTESASVQDFAMADEIGAGDSLEEIARKVSRRDALAAQWTGERLGEAELAAAADALDAAARILTIGMGSSAIAADDSAFKLRILGSHAVGSADVHEALALAATFGAADVVLAFSHEGRSREVIDVVAAARERGARTILVSNREASPAARGADVVIRTSAPPTSFRAGGMASRIAQLTVVDILFAALAARRSAVTETAAQMQAAVRAHVAGGDG